MTEFNMERTDFDVMANEILEFTAAKDIIRCINTLYNANLSLDGKVTRLSTESNKDGKQRRADIMLAIDERVFHAEIQRTHDADMVFRVFDYGYRYAIGTRTQGKDSLVLDFPDPVVIYLNDKGSTPTEFTVTLNFNHADSYSYNIPVKRLGDYTPDELINGCLYALCPFYPLKYETALSKEHDRELEEKFAIEIKSITDWIGKKVDNDEMSKIYSTLLANALERVIGKVKSEAKIIDEEAMDKIMENVQTRKYVLDPLNWFAEGEAKKGLEVAKELFDMGMTPDQVARAIKVPVDVARGLQPN